MKKLALLFVFLFASVAAAQTPALPSQSAADPKCGEGIFVVRLAGQRIGTETFMIGCDPGGGYSALGITKLDLGGSKIDLSTAIRTDARSIAMKYSVKGSAAGTPVDTSWELNNGVATVTNTTAPTSPELKGASVTSAVNYTPGAVMLTNTVSYIFQFAVDRYDSAKGGKQELTFYPNVPATLEFVTTDEVMPGKPDAGLPLKFGRYIVDIGGTKIYLWTDLKGRVTLLAQPGQKFTSARQEFDAYSNGLIALVTAPAPKLDYSAPASAPFTAEEVTVPAKGHTLAGTLLLPKNARGKLPAVITITGSGQETRDEPLPIENLEKYRPFRQIAEALASHGIAVLRVDDRGVGSSTGMEGLANATTADFADDTRAQVAYLRTRKEIDPKRIALAGHSEGGIIAPMVAADDPQIAAIVILAGTAQRGDAVLLYQFNRGLDTDAAAGLTEAQKTAAREENAAMIRTAAAGGDTSQFPPILQSQWTRWFLNYDPAPTIRKVKQPILILQGDLDQQVIRTNAGILVDQARGAGNRQVEVHYYPTLNHLFLPSKTGDGSEYSSLTVQEIPADVIDTLTSWLVKTLRVK